MSEITLGYWGIRGRGQIPRHLLAYSGLPFTEKVYKAFEEYAGEKFNLGIDFPNLPYLIDGDVKISETWAVCRYILKKSGKN
jgi:glutathione S-transferase